jgi:hypothetical protein
MVTVSFVHTGELNVERTLEGIAARSEEMAPAWDLIQDYFVKISNTQFKNGGRRGPNKWAPLSPDTIARKRRLGGRTAKMIRSEALMNALTSKDAANQVFIPEREHMLFGADLEQFETQQAGIPEIPFRPPIDPTQRDVRNMTIIISEYVVGARAVVNL